MEENEVKEWVIFGLFLIVGVGMLIAGLFYMNKEKKDSESVKIYRIVSIIGVIITIGAALYRF
jgi:putative Mn2+ efflux pump MntP